MVDDHGPASSRSSGGPGHWWSPPRPCGASEILEPPTFVQGQKVPSTAGQADRGSRALKVVSKIRGLTERSSRPSTRKDSSRPPTEGRKPPGERRYALSGVTDRGRRCPSIWRSAREPEPRQACSGAPVEAGRTQPTAFARISAPHRVVGAASAVRFNSASWLRMIPARLSRSSAGSSMKRSMLGRLVAK